MKWKNIYVEIATDFQLALIKKMAETASIVSLRPYMLIMLSKRMGNLAFFLESPSVNAFPL